MRVSFYKLLPEIYLLGIFFSTALLMTGYELLKEIYFELTLTHWESHLITVMVTATFATVTAFFIRKWAVKVNEQLRIAATAFDEAQEGMLATDANVKIMRVNRAFTRITGYLPEEAIGKNPRILSSGRQDANFYAVMWENIQRTGEWEGDIWNRRKSGEIYPEYLTITAVKGSNGEITHYIATMNDITERKRMDEQIYDLAFYDPLTRLPNRRLLNDRLEQAIAASKRNGHYGALMFLDLDKFKPLNDTQGHDVGDLLLVEVANRISSCVREIDTVVRFGGDEFMVMLGELSGNKVESATEAGIVAEKIRTILAEPYVLKLNDQKSHQHHCTVSIGIMLFINHDGCAKDIIKFADIAMYQAKDAGGNSVSFYDSMA